MYLLSEAWVVEKTRVIAWWDGVVVVVVVVEDTTAAVVPAEEDTHCLVVVMVHIHHHQPLVLDDSTYDTCNTLIVVVVGENERGLQAMNVLVVVLGLLLCVWVGVPLNGYLSRRCLPSRIQNGHPTIHNSVRVNMGRTSGSVVPIDYMAHHSKNVAETLNLLQYMDSPTTLLYSIQFHCTSLLYHHIIMTPPQQNIPEAPKAVSVLPESTSNNNHNDNDNNDDTSKAPQQDTTIVADWEQQRDDAKTKGDNAFRLGNYAKAIDHYTIAISLDPDMAVLYSNRSAAHVKAGHKSKALHDAQHCVSLQTMGSKGYSRLAAAQQALGRYKDALQNWKRVQPPTPASTQGIQDCEKVIQQQAEFEKQQQQQEQQENDEDDLLDDFFDDVEQATAQVVQEKLAQPDAGATNAILHSKQTLGTASDQMKRLLAPNYQWRNLNPYFVMNLPHTASNDDISKRYKALSLLLHPDKNRQDTERAQQAFEQVKKAKAILDDDNRANYCQQLVEQGMKQGKYDWEQQQKRKAKKQTTDSKDESLEDLQSKEVQRIFAQVERKRREVEQREREYEQRERQQEEQEEQKAKQERTFDKEWKQEVRVEKRIGNWRDFQGGSSKKKKKH